jgi:Phosphodiester glycosidase
VQEREYETEAGSFIIFRRHLIAAAVVALTMALALVATADAAPKLPASFKSAERQTLGTGLEHDTLTGRTPDEVINVARIDRGAPFELHAVPANGGIGRGLERTSSICGRVHCVAAVNGDFFGPRGDIPLGAVVSLGQLLRAPLNGHPQLMLSGAGAPSAGDLALTATLVTDDLQSLGTDGVNQTLTGNGVVLYTTAIGSTTGTPNGTTEIAVTARNPAGPLLLGKTTLVHVDRTPTHGGNAPVPANGAILAARGSGVARVNDLLRRVRAESSPDALLRVGSSGDTAESIGGGPMLVHNGAVAVPDVRNDFFLGRHPRTIVGWTSRGDILLVTVDGRQPGRSAGMTLVEAARFMIAMGATEAMNLDGGGSTTFVAKGRVLNRPSDRAIRRGKRTIVLGDVSSTEPVLGYVERPVATALVVVPKAAKPASVSVDALAALPLQAMPAASTPRSDVVSASGSLPEIVVPVRSRSPLVLIALVSVALAFAGAAGHRRFVLRR